MKNVFDLLIGKFATVYNPMKDMLVELKSNGLISFAKGNDKDNIVITLTEQLESDIVNKYVSAINDEDSSFNLWYNSNLFENGNQKVSNVSGAPLNPQLTLSASSSELHDLFDLLNNHS